VVIKSRITPFMRESSSLPPRLSWQPWFLCLLAAYAVLQLSFNHRLLELAGGMLTGVDATRVQAMEYWARVVAGLGLGLPLMRWLDRFIPSRFWLVMLCSAIGIFLMWHLQKALVDAIVAGADEKDMQMSVQSHLSTTEALKGRIELRGQPVLEAPAPPPLRPIMAALWSSSVLGLNPDDLEVTAGAAQLARSWMLTSPSHKQLRDAYRKAVMMPVSLGTSLFFGLLNLCQLMVGLVVLLLSRMGASHWRRNAERGLLPALFLGIAAISWWSGNDWVDSPGYSQVARPALWQDKPFLAPFVEWSLRAEPAWSDPVAWVHRELLGDFDFRDTWQATPRP
jgi:4-hydroxybenzoate polyprenyltransferase